MDTMVRNKKPAVAEPVSAVRKVGMNGLLWGVRWMSGCSVKGAQASVTQAP